VLKFFLSSWAPAWPITEASEFKGCRIDAEGEWVRQWWEQMITRARKGRRRKGNEIDIPNVWSLSNFSDVCACVPDLGVWVHCGSWLCPCARAGLRLWRPWRTEKK